MEVKWIERGKEKIYNKLGLLRQVSLPHTPLTMGNPDRWYSVFHFGSPCFRNPVRRRWLISTRSRERKTEIFRSRRTKIQKFVGVVQLFNLKRQKCSKNYKLHRKATVTNRSIFGECFLFDKKIIPFRLKQW